LANSPERARAWLFLLAWPWADGGGSEPPVPFNNHGGAIAHARKTHADLGPETGGLSHGWAGVGAVECLGYASCDVLHVSLQFTSCALGNQGGVDDSELKVEVE
jgi:hypothetical protein